MIERTYREVFRNVIEFYSNANPLDPDGNEIGKLVVGPEWYGGSGRHGFWWFKIPSGRWFTYCRDGRKKWVDKGYSDEIEKWLEKGEDPEHQIK